MKIGKCFFFLFFCERKCEDERNVENLLSIIVYDTHADAAVDDIVC